MIVTRGWTDVQNRGSARLSSPVRLGKEYTFRWDQEPKDYIVEAGHRIGLVVLSTDYDYTLRPQPGTEHLGAAGGERAGAADRRRVARAAVLTRWRRRAGRWVLGPARQPGRPPGFGERLCFSGIAGGNAKRF